MTPTGRPDGKRHQCYECGRWGTRAMHQLSWGEREGQWRCDSAIACDARAYKLRWGGTR